jgi:hypothetical protein
MAGMNPELAAAILDVAKRNKWDPVDLGTAISYETAGTWDPWKAGPTTQWGQHRGLIQWGEPQAKQYGVTKDMSVTDQMNAVERYLKDRGVQPGAGLMDIYSTINAGAPGLYNRSDANNGGAPGTVADKVNSQMADHRMKAAALLGVDAPVGALAAKAIPSDPVSPINPTSTSSDVPLPVAAAPTLESKIAGLAESLGPKKGEQATAPEYAPLQNIQMPQPMAGQSQQIAAAIAKMYGIGV